MLMQVLMLTSPDADADTDIAESACSLCLVHLVCIKSALTQTYIAQFCALMVLSDLVTTLIHCAKGILWIY